MKLNNIPLGNNSTKPAQKITEKDSLLKKVILQKKTDTEFIKLKNQ